MMAPSSPASCKNCSCFNPSEPLTQSHWSRLESQLRRNQPLSDIERQTVAKVEQDIEGYDHEIARMKFAIVSLQYKRNLAKDYVSRHKSLLAPIRRIPNEVLMEIFGHCSAEATIGPYWMHLPQLRLSQVCSHWRSIINASPALWSTFGTTLSHPTPVDAIFSDIILTNIVNMFLTRSGDHSLTIRLSQDGTDHIHPTLQPLLNHSHRWIDATLGFQGSLVERIYPACTGFARLRHLDTVAGAMFAALAAPCLRSLRLDLDNVLLKNRDFPWSQLREIELFNSTTVDCTDIFWWCKQLQHASLIFGTPTSSDQFITSTTVVSMALKDREEEDGIKDFLRLAQFPQLQTLELTICRFSLASAYSFILCSPMITTLSLKWCIFDFGDILELLRLLPTIVSFQWYHSWSTVMSGTVDSFFSKLCPYPSGTLLPRLKHLNVQIQVFNAANSTDFNVVVSSFIDMVQARWIEKPENERLKSVQLSFPQNCLNRDLVQPLVYLRDNGMVISIQDKCGPLF